MTSMDPTTVLEFRRDKDAFFKDSFDSPLPYDVRKQFSGLSYFDPNPDLVFTLPVEPGDGKEIVIKTSDERDRIYRRAGQVSFEVAGNEVTLTVYDTGHPGYFLPFRDSTSGKETYGAGRYLELDTNDDGTITIDFNMAYNPYCVYNEGYSCPIPPVDNWLQVPIEAGEKDFVG
ncbi:MAG: DUF1684 domain-containing protein [Actinomycetota bacterium]|nr:DUF1684 domain-containing protein [Actinomycetota bacterium]